MQETVTIALFNENLGVHVEHEVSEEVLAYIEALEAEIDNLEVELDLVKDVFAEVATELNATLDLRNKAHEN